MILTIIKLISIFLCFLYVLFRKDRDFLLKIAFLFTFASDLILAKYYAAPIGTLVFCFAQLIHFIRLCNNKSIIKIYIPIAILILAFGFFFGDQLLGNSIFIYAAVYAITEIFNFIFAFSFSKTTTIGFGLFLLCDLCIAIGFIFTGVATITDWLCWVFYLPAQILLATSHKDMIK